MAPDTGTSGSSRDRTPELDPDVLRFYSERSLEPKRLKHGRGQLEFARTKDLLRRVLPPAPGRILDIGGGTGVYAAWLAEEGYDVKLVEPVPALLAYAEAAARQDPKRAFETELGDARQLDEETGSADAVLLLGPLYHLPERRDRHQALREARRVVRPNGVVAASGISRFAVLLDAMRMGRLDEATVRRTSEGSLATGRHDARLGFTTAYFHRPEELRDEFMAAELEAVQLMAIEGPGWLLLPGEPDPDYDRPLDPALVAGASHCAAAVENEPALLGASAHLLAVGRRGRS